MSEVANFTAENIPPPSDLSTISLGILTDIDPRADVNSSPVAGKILILYHLLQPMAIYVSIGLGNRAPLQVTLSMTSSWHVDSPDRKLV